MKKSIFGGISVGGGDMQKIAMIVLFTAGEVVFVKVMNADVSILTTTCITSAIRLKRKRVDRTEMALQLGDFIFKDSVEKTSFESTGTSRSGRHIPCILTTSQYDL